MKLVYPESFVSSLSFDFRLAPYDIEGSIAHVTMLGKKRILHSNDVKKIIRGLNAILRDLKKGKPIASGEDIHFAIERELIKRIGDPGRRMHTGRSRNDQVITDLHLYMKENVVLLQKEIKALQKALVEKARQTKTVLMPGFTHLQHAQPILMAHHFLAYAWMFERDRSRLADLAKRLDVLPLGSAAMAGTSFPIDRKAVARQLGFKNISENSIDATASRDTVVEFLAVASISMVNLSRLAEELILWSSSEFSFVRLAEAYTTGSSIMPQKRNPDMAELIRGKTGRVFGGLVSVLTILKGTPLAYNRDLQEDKPPLFDGCDTWHDCLNVMAPMIKTMKVNAKVLRNWCNEGFLSATELADTLTKKGVPFREAHGVVKKVVRTAESKRKRLDQISSKELRGFHEKFEASDLSILKPEKVVQAKTSYGGTSPQSVRTQIQKLQSLLK